MHSKCIVWIYSSLSYYILTEYCSKLIFDILPKACFYVQQIQLLMPRWWDCIAFYLCYLFMFFFFPEAPHLNSIQGNNLNHMFIYLCFLLSKPENKFIRCLVQCHLYFKSVILFIRNDWSLMGNGGQKCLGTSNHRGCS